jgi:hypothetical protein
MAKYTDGDLKNILSNVDIYQSNLKTWTDLQEYISLKTDGKISPEELNKIAAAILTDIDPSISILREKLLTYSKNYESGTIIRQSVATVDISNIKIKGKWLQTFYNESVKQGLTHNQMADMLVIISSYPGTKTKQFLSDLIEQSDEPLLSSLKSLDLKKEKIKAPKDLLLFLITNKDKVKYPEEVVYKSIANLITSKDIPADTITSQLTAGKKNWLWILWIMIGASLFFIFIIFRKRKKNKK